MSKKFLTSNYKEHREHVLFDQQKAMMPATQPYATQEIGRRENERLLVALHTERAVLKRKLVELSNNIVTVQRRITPPLQEKKEFVHKCADENCKGFLSIAWKCGTCQMYTCPECNKLKGLQKDDPLHVCKEEDKQTWKAIKQDCKKCPGCSTFVYKISGCDQMWCVTCHTTWSWTTGRRANGTIHNPHWYEFQRTGGQLNRALGDIPCGGMPTVREMRAKLSSESDARARQFFIFHRLITHIEHEELPRYPTEAREETFLDLRIGYMLNDYDEDTFKRKLQQREKQTDKKKEIGLVLQMIAHTGADLLRSMIANNEDPNYISIQLDELINYANSVFNKISKTYACVAPFISLSNNYITLFRY